MIFKAELAAKVMTGDKTVTRRLCSDNPRSPWWREQCTYQPGKVATVNPGRGIPNIGSIRITALRRERLGHLHDEEARAEGFADAAEFEEGFAGINGGYDPNLEVWVLGFEVCEVRP